MPIALFVRFAGVAQLVRASGSYPLGPGFKSLHRHHLYFQRESAVQVIGYFNFVNRIADGLGIDLQADMPPDQGL